MEPAFTRLIPMKMASAMEMRLQAWPIQWHLDSDADGTKNILNWDADSDGFSDGYELHLNTEPLNALSTPALLPVERGTLNVDQNWQGTLFQKDFVNPIVVANAPTLKESDPAVIRIQNANSQSFEICLQEWQYLDGTHSPETVSYIVMEKGVL